MDPRVLAIITVRGLATLFELQGHRKQAASLNLLAVGIESGVDVDEHMRGVAAALAENDGNVSAAMWDDVHARITADSERLQAR